MVSSSFRTVPTDPSRCPQHCRWCHQRSTTWRSLLGLIYHRIIHMIVYSCIMKNLYNISDYTYVCIYKHWYRIYRSIFKGIRMYQNVVLPSVSLNSSVISLDTMTEVWLKRPPKEGNKMVAWHGSKPCFQTSHQNSWWIYGSPCHPKMYICLT